MSSGTAGSETVQDNWAAAALIRPGLLVLAGAVGTADMHAHHTVQLIAGRTEILLGDSAGEYARCRAAIIPADVPHKVVEGAADAVLVHIDPESPIGMQLGRLPQPRHSVTAWIAAAAQQHLEWPGMLPPASPTPHSAQRDSAQCDAAQCDAAQGKSVQRDSVQRGSGQRGSGQHGSGQHGSAQHDAVQCGPRQRDSAQHGSGQHDSAQCGSGQHDSAQHDAVQCGPRQRDSAQHGSGQRDSVQCGSGRRDSVQCGSGRRDSAQCGSGRRDSAQCGSGQRDSAQCGSGQRGSASGDSECDLARGKSGQRESASGDSAQHRIAAHRFDVRALVREWFDGARWTAPSSASVASAPGRKGAAAGSSNSCTWLGAAPDSKALPEMHPAVSEVLRLLPGRLTAGPIRLRDIAREVHISESRLAHVFSAEIGLPFRPYLLWLRLQRAVELIAAGNSLTAVAHGAGFSDSAHLTRVCRRMFGGPPSQFNGIHWDIEPAPSAQSSTAGQASGVPVDDEVQPATPSAGSRIKSGMTGR